MLGKTLVLGIFRSATTSSRVRRIRWEFLVEELGLAAEDIWITV